MRPGANVDLTRAGHFGGPELVWLNRVLAEGEFSRSRSWVSSSSWATVAEGIPLVPKMLAHSGSGHTAALYEFEDGTQLVLHVETYDADLHDVWVAASGADAEAALALIEAIAPEAPTVTEDGGVEFGYWGMGPMGPERYSRRINGEGWSTIRGNYPTETRTKISQLMAMDDPGSGGKLILFHGPPGTGKTRSIMSLAVEWADWCDVEVVTDTDEFFRSAAYLNSVLLKGYYYSDRWRLLVFEDGDEFLDASAKSQVGQGLSRLLNLADGLIGQGTRLLTLISTNVPHDQFHAAIVREGRCLAQLEFPPFSPAEAQEWLAEHGISAELPPDRESWSLAELYGQLRGAEETAEFALRSRVTL